MGSVRDSQFWSAARQRRFRPRTKQRAGSKAASVRVVRSRTKAVLRTALQKLRGERDGSVRDSQLWSAARQRRFRPRTKQRAGSKAASVRVVRSRTKAVLRTALQSRAPRGLSDRFDPRLP